MRELDGSIPDRREVGRGFDAGVELEKIFSRREVWEAIAGEGARSIGAQGSASLHRAGVTATEATICSPITTAKAPGRFIVSALLVRHKGDVKVDSDAQLTVLGLDGLLRALCNGCLAEPGN